MNGLVSFVCSEESRARGTRLECRWAEVSQQSLRTLHWWVSPAIVCQQRILNAILQLTQLPEDTLRKPFILVEAKVQELQAYVAKWLQFQSLWDLEQEYVFSRLGDSLLHWQQLLTEIKKTRATFDTSETRKSFGGVCVVEYEQVQARVNAKYDSWQKDILSRFGVKLGNVMREMHASILKARNDLEQHSIEGLIGGGTRRF